jgi:hypothetical protein
MRNALLFLLLFLHDASPVISDQDSGTKNHAKASESFTEDLLLRPLADGNVLAHFSMSMTWPVSRRREDGGAHYSIFP